MIKQQEEQIDTLLRQKCYLEARILGLNEEEVYCSTSGDF